MASNALLLRGLQRETSVPQRGLVTRIIVTRGSVHPGTAPSCTDRGVHCSPVRFSTAQSEVDFYLAGCITVVSLQAHDATIAANAASTANVKQYSAGVRGTAENNNRGPMPGQPAAGRGPSGACPSSGCCCATPGPASCTVTLRKWPNP
jgi:hypothetical protein